MLYPEVDSIRIELNCRTPAGVTELNGCVGMLELVSEPSPSKDCFVSALSN